MPPLYRDAVGPSRPKLLDILAVSTQEGVAYLGVEKEEHMAIEVKAERNGREWDATLTVDGEKIRVRARTFAEITALAERALGDAGHEGETLRVTTEYDDAKRGADQASAEAEAAAKMASEIRRSIIRKMRADGLSQEDVGAILGISRQRVSQLSG